MKPDPDNQLRKRIADALLAGDPCGHPDREIERALDAVRDSGEASELTDIEIGRILLKMRRKLPIGERVADAEAPAPFPAVEAKQKEQTPDRETVNNESKVPLAGNTIELSTAYPVGSTRPSIELDCCEDVTIEDNKFVGFDWPIQIESSNDTKNVKLKNNSGLK